MRAEMEMLWEFHERRLKPGTPPRALADRVAFSQDPPLRLAQCRQCTLIYRNPRERAVELVETYATEMPDDATLRTLHENQRRAYRAQVHRLERVLGRRGPGLEVGSYVGAFLAAARDVGWTFEGLDVNERAASFACSMGFRVTVGELDDMVGRRFDTVAIWNCFDQLPDPRSAATTARALLSRGGVIAIRVPNGDAYANVRRALRTPLARWARALLAHNNLLGFPYRHGFTTRSLTRLLTEAGFGDIRFHGDVLVPVSDHWTRRWARREERAVKWLLRGAARSGRLRARISPWIE
ncbi:MAG: class I SAM-dependent methyltransferase, partial [Gemmatimonadota bacterium]|nr:class I SAM-dependent methyltransferase [Gemmatimonadota bacterium]